MAAGFIFATGVENSYPTIRSGTHRVDEMEKCGHYTHWKRDFECVVELGIEFLRYGPPIHTTWLGPGRYDWEFADLTFAEMKRLRIMPMVDLCHFGVPDWIGNFQNGDFPDLFAIYARDFAARFPWVQLYTPVNEMFICATFSGRNGWWNEQMTSDQGFVTALKHLVKANVLAMQAILEVRPDALFIQSESSEYFHASSPAAIKLAETYNQQRFLTLDLNYGQRVNSDMYEFLMDNGMTRDEYHFFLNQHLRRHCIMGTDYYFTNEHRVYADGRVTASGEVFGYDEITRQYHDRYQLPVMHTETNLWEGPTGQEAVDWLWKQWANVLRVRNIGIPILGFTWYSITDQVDWDSALREDNGTVNPLGLFDLDRNIRPVGKCYKQLIKDWSTVLPAQSHCLVLPLDMPDGDNAEPDSKAERLRRHAVRNIGRTGGARRGPGPGPDRSPGPPGGW
ncbi:glycosyl hydrolase family protein [Rubellimicrobium rubrum]|uniref:Glycosyl hydrolase family protein n=1 Tax=Rubellimicrobium rubrum TaxID=2585369 RepID=A0A5C4MQZ3_9RHOB|nr:family 1 glycosylhydrolase [Rubellimicrobium rubrum]TNC46867.1 glycosyl hydrolase family protein [Rubellimicrobium rubrum]